ncbi:MAG: hypothetical protein AAFP69_22430, partial [Planctomycetota bacterium]
FWSSVMPSINYAAGTPIRNSALLAYETWLRKQMSATDGDSREVWGRLLSRCQAWANDQSG